MATRIGDETAARIENAWPDLLDKLAAGSMVRVALADLGLKPEHVRAYLKANPSARTDWDDAREQSADAFMDDALEVAYNREIDPAHARMRVDTLKWAARIRNPRLYGDKSQLDVNVKTIDLTRIITDAQARLAAATAGRTIEHSAHLLHGKNAAVSDSEH